MKVNVKNAKEDNRVNVRNENTPSLTAVADDMRSLSKKNYRLVKKLSRLQRKLDKKYAKLSDPQDTCVALASLSNREYKQALKLAKTLRHSDKVMDKAQNVERNAKRERFEQAQLEVM